MNILFPVSAELHLWLIERMRQHHEIFPLCESSAPWARRLSKICPSLLIMPEKGGTEPPRPNYIEWAKRSDPFLQDYASAKQIVSEAIQESKADLVVCWNGKITLLAQMAVEAGREAGVPVALIELGFFRRPMNSLQISLSGINAENALNLPPIPAFHPVGLTWKSFCSNELFAPGERTGEPVVVLQVPDDTQIFPHNYQQFVEKAQLSFGRTALFKPHPVKSMYVQSEDDIHLRPEIAILDAPMQETLNTASAVITFNSLAGFEALMRGIPVLADGDAFYRDFALPCAPEFLGRPIPNKKRLAAFFRKVFSQSFMYQGDILRQTVDEDFFPRLAAALESLSNVHLTKSR